MRFLSQLVDKCHAGIIGYPEALKYLKSREVTADDIRDFKLGYSKVISAQDDGSEDYKRYQIETKRSWKLQGKIILPFIDGSGTVIGLAGRAIDTKEFKTFVSDHGKFEGFFFGLYQALPHIIREGKVYVVEGYFDLLAMRKVFPNSVASITSGMNEAQYEQLSFYCNDIIVCFDSDVPGQRGKDKAVEWKGVRSMSIGKYKDPAVILEKLKLDGFKKYMLAHAPKF